MVFVSRVSGPYEQGGMYAVPARETICYYFMLTQHAIRTRRSAFIAPKKHMYCTRTFSIRHGTPFDERVSGE